MERIKPPATRKGNTHKIELAGTDSYVTINRLPDGRAIEIFLTTDRKGECQGWANVACIMISMALQNGVPPARIIGKMKGQRFDPQGGAGEPVSVADAIAKIWAKEEGIKL
jgi:hypothetical protein